MGADCASADVVVGKASYFMVLGVDVAVRTAGMGCGGVSVIEHIVPPGASLPMQAMDIDAMLVGLAGCLSVSVGSRNFVLCDSGAALVPSGRRFSYRNESAGEARLMVFTFGSAQEAFLREAARDPRKLGRTALSVHRAMPRTDG